jgi:hypothetical protein
MYKSLIYKQLYKITNNLHRVKTPYLYPFIDVLNNHLLGFIASYNIPINML